MDFASNKPITPNQLIRTIREQWSPPVTFIALSGGSCTGKSSIVSKKIKEAFGNECLVIGMDHFMKSDGPLDPRYKWDNPDHFDLKACSDTCRKLKTGENAVMPRFSFKDKRTVGTQTLTPHPLIVLEGLYAGTESLLTISDLTIYVEAPLYARLLRRLCRNTRERYIGRDPAQILEGFLTSVDNAHGDFVSHQRNTADFIIQNTYTVQQSIDQFDLQPLAVAVVKDPVFKHTIDDNSHIYLETLSHDSYSFGLVLHDECYLHFTISKTLARHIMSIDLDIH